MDEANETVSRAEAIRRIRVLDHVVTEESGHLTQSQKLKRSQLIEDFADEVDALYQRR